MGLMSPAFGEIIVSPAASAIEHHAVEVHLGLWHGLSPTLLLSLVTIAAGIAVYAGRQQLLSLVEPANVISKYGPERWYFWILDGTLRFGSWQTRLLQSGYLRNYLFIIILTMVTFGLYPLFTYEVLTDNVILRPPNVTTYELIIELLVVAGAIMVVLSRSRLAAVAALGVVGYGVALIFVMFGAPDLAMTQFSIETLSVILLVLVLYRLPRFVQFTRSRVKQSSDIVVAVVGGGFMALLVMLVTALPGQSRLAPFFSEASYVEAHGHNVVNVILVDFRGFDTMGEITVLGIAAIGVFSLLKLRLEKRKAAVSTDQPEEHARPQEADHVKREALIYKE